MKDIILILTAYMVGYVCFMISVIFLIKLFFPFFTKEELEKRKTMKNLKQAHI